MAILTPVAMTKNSFANSTGWTTFATSSALTTLTIQQDEDDKIIVFVTGEHNAATTPLTALVRAYAGTARRAWREGVGNADFTFLATATTVTLYKALGPFESARFNTVSTSTASAPVGRGYIKLTPFRATTAGATSTHTSLNKGILKAIAFKLPGVTYST